MITEEKKLEYTVCESAASPVPVIVVAAGSSRRMGGVNKLLIEICEVPVIARTLTVLQNCPLVSKIILVTKAEDIFLMQSVCNKYGITKISDITPGGDTRHKSVLCGISRLSEGESTVLIHDGARPFLTNAMIADCVSALSAAEGCLCAIPVTDTVKRTGGDGRVEKTVDRAGLYLAQTPQGVRVKDYLAAAKEDLDYTDDASVLEAAGLCVKVVAGDKRNIKITTIEDVSLAECMIKGGLV